MDQNKGFSLIELLAVITILILLAAGGIMLFSRTKYTDTNTAARKVDVLMSKVRLETMSKDVKQYLYLYQLDGTLYLKISDKDNGMAAQLDAATGTKLAAGLDLFYKRYNREETAMTGSIDISFDRSSGAFDRDLEYIAFKKNNKSTIIRCVPETGRHWIE